MWFSVDAACASIKDGKSGQFVAAREASSCMSLHIDTYTRQSRHQIETCMSSRRITLTEDKTYHYKLHKITQCWLDKKYDCH